MVEVRLTFPDSLTPFAKVLQATGEAIVSLHAEIAAKGGAVVDYGNVEQAIGKQLGEVERGAHQALLGELDVDAPYVRVWGKHYRRVGRRPGTYYCMAGPVTVTRTVYRQLGERSGESVDSISLRTGVVADGWLPRTARAMAHLIAKGTSREAADTSDELLRLPYSRSSFERVGHAVAGQLVTMRTQVEKTLIEAYTVPTDAKSVSVSLDRVSVPMEEPLEDESRGAGRTSAAHALDAELAELEPRFEIDPHTIAAVAEAKRAATEAERKVARNFRMAYCATVTLHDAKGKALHTIRYGRMPQGEPRELLRGLLRDVTAMRGERPELRVVFVADGAPELWHLFDQYLGPKALGTKPIRLVDYWHVVEYLGAAATLMESRKASWPGTLRRWQTCLLEKAGGAKVVLQELKASGLATTKLSDGSCPVGDAIRYIEKRVKMMRYAAARRFGLAIGSGAVEATCKSLVNLRMKRPGSRWKEDTGAEILELRALYLSDRWERGVTLSLRPLAKSVARSSRQEAIREAA